MSDPTPANDLLEALLDLLSEGSPWSVDDLLAGLAGAGFGTGATTRETVVEALELDLADDVVAVDAERYVHLPSLLRDRWFTRQMSAREIDGDYVPLDVDLLPLATLSAAAHLSGPHGSDVILVIDDDQDAAELLRRGLRAADLGFEGAWLLEPGTLHDLVSPGGLLAFRVDGAVLDLTAVPSTDGAEETAALAGLAIGDEPLAADEAVAAAIGADPTAFRFPAPPLSHLLAAAGLAHHAGYVAPDTFDFASWHIRLRVENVRLHHEVDATTAEAVVGITETAEILQSLIDRAGEPDSDTADHQAGAGPELGGDDPAPHALLPTLARPMLPHLQDPVTAEIVLADLRARVSPGAIGLLADVLLPGAPVSARPALLWLRGCANDALGDAPGAEASFDAALSDDPWFAPALNSMAELLNVRGDATKALALVQRAGDHADPDLRDLLTAFTPPQHPELRRNDPCWCGSGRKYKHCHLHKEELPLSRRAAWLYHKAARHLDDHELEFITAAEIRAGYLTGPDAFARAVADPLVTDAVLFEGGAFADFLTRRGSLLPPDEHDLALRWLQIARSVFEVEDVTPGTGFTARDLRTGDVVVVTERTASGSLRPGWLLCGRIVPTGDTWQVFGGLERVRPHEVADILDLLDADPSAAVLVDRLSRYLAPPTVTTTDGEPLVICAAQFRVPDPTAAAAALDSAFDVASPGEEPSRWTHHADLGGTLGDTVISEWLLDGDVVSVSTSNEARFEAALAWLRTTIPEAEPISETRRNLTEVLATEAGDVEPREQPDPAPELVTALAEATARYEEQWLDLSIPALRGLTPREAAADPTRREDVIRLLATFPESDGSPGMMDPQRLRRALGLLDG